jgi:uncharacterized protein (TIGR02722 family)
MKNILTVCAVFIVALSGCSTQVKRIDSNTQTDLSGYWNDTDVRIICEALINDCLSNPRVDQAIRAMGGKTPVVIVGRFRNESSEHIDTGIITSIMEATIFNSGKLDFVAGGDTRDELRAERTDQLQGYTSDATASVFGNETGANFMLTGTVRTIIDREGNRTVRTYFVNAEMTSIETNQRMWMGQNNEIKKVITRPRNRL